MVCESYLRNPSNGKAGTSKQKHAVSTLARRDVLSGFSCRFRHPHGVPEEQGLAQALEEGWGLWRALFLGVSLRF